ncbi:hypothetical protein [Pseudomonas sp. Irchel s3b6]|uniref:hypothetical protein n=1 Tax=Pseudomonas sp. Irchel s3b6 TaxID=2009078 RepID=UPI000BA3F2A6|nr:hypothetical protein [Pseudomonas sp. Irchel s3b6]
MSLKLLLLFLHLLFVATWLGCILVEAVYEHAIEPSASMREFIAQLHWTTDKYIEVPAIVGVLLSGGWLLSLTAITPLLLMKIGFGLLAVLFNMFCVVLVIKRMTAVRKRDFQRYEKLDRLQHKFGAVVLFGVVVALGIGGYLFAQGRY